MLEESGGQSVLPGGPDFPIYPSREVKETEGRRVSCGEVVPMAGGEENFL